MNSRTSCQGRVRENDDERVILEGRQGPVLNEGRRHTSDSSLNIESTSLLLIFPHASARLGGALIVKLMFRCPSPPRPNSHDLHGVGARDNSDLFFFADRAPRGEVVLAEQRREGHHKGHTLKTTPMLSALRSNKDVAPLRPPFSTLVIASEPSVQLLLDLPFS